MRSPPSDPFHWLRAPNWQEVMTEPTRLPPKIRAHLEAQNTLTQKTLPQALEHELFVEMKGRLPQKDSSVPTPDGPYVYFSRYVPQGEHPVLCRSHQGHETVLLDANVEAHKSSFYRLGWARHSPDHAYLAHSADRQGAELYSLRIRDLATGHDLPDEIHRISPSAVWGQDSRTLFYVALDENHRPSRVMRHRLGETEDQMVYEEQDPGFFVSLSKTQNGRFIIISPHDHTTSEIHLIDNPDAPPLCLLPRQQGVEFILEYDAPRKRFLILTNAQRAQDFKIVALPEHSKTWEDMVPAQDGVLKLSHVVFRDHMVFLELSRGLPRLWVYNLKTQERHTLEFQEDIYDLDILPGYTYDTSTLRFTYSSMTTPEETWDYHMETRQRTLRKKQEVPSGHDSSRYVACREFARAEDGVEIPISLLWRAGTPLDGTAPLLLYGYGAYGIIIPAAFSPSRLSLVDRGFIYAIAHVRGGRECGQRWYLEGRGAQKINTFRDYIASAHHLVARGMVKEGNITGHGGSAGGMLMGAVANMASELFRSVVAEVPFVDVLSTMLDESLPLTPPEWPEWGNPQNPEDYNTIAAYSPYDNIREQNYPHILATTAVSDVRVLYWEAAKWVARLQAQSGTKNLVLLKTNMTAGHGGSGGRFERLKEVATVYAFILTTQKYPRIR